jgi:hypothetical protein
MDDNEYGDGLPMAEDADHCYAEAMMDRRRVFIKRRAAAVGGNPLRLKRVGAAHLS